MIINYFNKLRQSQLGITPTPSIQFRAATNGVFRGGFNPGSVTLSGLTSGDFVIAILSDSGTTEPPLSSGWTNIDVTTTTHALRAAYIFATGADVTYTATFFSGSNGSMVLAAFSGVDSSTPLDVTPTKNVVTDLNSITPAAITPATAGSMIFIGAGCEAPEVTFTDPTGYTRADVGFGGTATLQSNTLGVYKSVSTTNQESPGAIGISATRNARTITIAMRPA